MRPKLHYRPERNWINDPNGLCQVDGWYHLFFQYNPHGSVWGDMHWGHARSRDLYRWEDLPIAMTPREDLGEIHCFSGSCCKDNEGRPHFFYTSIGPAEIGRDCADGAQQWHAEPADHELTRLVQTDEGAVLDSIHGGFHVRDWRDPSVMPYADGYLMALGGCLEGHGCVLLYSSPDMRRWTYRHVLLQSEIADNVPWECPNLFLLDGKVVVFWSPCGQVEYAVGHFDSELRLIVEKRGVLDPGERQGYYAPQAFRDEQGRTILLGWMPECDGDAAAIRRGWSGVMSLPRLLSIQNGDLQALPLPGWETRCAPAQAVPVDFPISAGQHFILRLRCPVAEAPLVITLLAAPDGSEQTLLTLTADGVLTLDRSRSTQDTAPATTPIQRTVPLPDGQAEVFLCVDGTAIECMVNGRWLSGRVYPQLEDAGMLTVRCEETTQAEIHPIL